MKSLDMFKLDGKVGVVTGGSMGLGRQMATALAEAGANVVIASRKLDKCEEVASELRTMGVKSIAVRCDIGIITDCLNLISETVKEFGTIDIMVNNAGITWGAPTLSYPLDKLDKLYQVNVRGTFTCAQAAGRVMIEQKKRGKIINISSVAGLSGSVTGEMVGYNTTKGALISMTKDLAVKWARYGINVNCIAPGWFVTKMTRGTLVEGDEGPVSLIPLGRYGGDTDLKGTIVFLASDASNYITGQIIVVDGGKTAR
ncbi:MAG: glucose 1-dehydrogenase [Syntrophomonadaceae bacterium]|jgi:NAD(P)-dependent dehydrogenase (short-subunit alcohol dehydrogenase family)